MYISVHEISFTLVTSVLQRMLRRGEAFQGRPISNVGQGLVFHPHAWARVDLVVGTT